LKQRFYYLDNLRVCLTILVVIFHTAIAYGGAGSWILEDADKSELNAAVILLTLLTAVCQSFFMGLFFFISSYFYPTSCARKGALRFLTGRLIRLGIPMLVYYFLIGPMTVWYAHFREQQTLAQFYADKVWSFRWTFFGPTWFLLASILFALCYVLFRQIPFSGLTDRALPFPNGKALLVTALSLGVIAFAVRLVYPTGTGPLELQLGYFPSYILLFVAGILAQKNGWLEQIPEKLRKRWMWIAIGVIPVLPIGLILTGALDGELQVEGGWHPQALLYAMWEPFVCLGIVMSLLAFFRDHLHVANRWTRWLADHAYTVYLIHPPVVVGWTIAWLGVDWPSLVKWVIVSALSVAACFILAGLIRKLPFATRAL
jgi:peptidoglycan/LPS O-acetylase OafA/YrhL